MSNLMPIMVIASVFTAFMAAIIITGLTTYSVYAFSLLCNGDSCVTIGATKFGIVTAGNTGHVGVFESRNAGQPPHPEAENGHTITDSNIRVCGGGPGISFPNSPPLCAP